MEWVPLLNPKYGPNIILGYFGVRREVRRFCRFLLCTFSGSGFMNLGLILSSCGRTWVMRRSSSIGSVYIGYAFVRAHLGKHLWFTPPTHQPPNCRSRYGHVGGHQASKKTLQPTRAWKKKRHKPKKTRTIPTPALPKMDVYVPQPPGRLPHSASCRKERRGSLDSSFQGLRA